MFDLNAYKKDCDRLNLGRDTLEEMIIMTEQKKKRGSRTVRVAVLAAALVAALGLTAVATDGPIRDMFEGFILTYTVTEKSDHESGIITVVGRSDDKLAGVALPTMAYGEKDGRKILTLNDEEIDVTEAMEKDGYYQRELEGTTLRVTADGTAVITVADISYTVDLTDAAGMDGVLQE